VDEIIRMESQSITLPVALERTKHNTQKMQIMLMFLMYNI